MRATLTIDSLGDLDSGAARHIVNRAIAEAVADLDDRGEDEKPRKVVIALQLKRADNGLVVGHVEASAKLPPWRTAGTVTELRQAKAGPQVVFQQFAPEEPRQETIDKAIHDNRQ